MNILFFLTPKNNVTYLYDDMNLEQVLDIMEEHHFAAVPIINHAGQYKGSITEGDLLVAIKNQYLKAYDNVKLMSIKRNHNNQSVHIDSNMEDLIDKALNQNFVPVVDDHNSFIGIITRKDIIKYYYKCSKNTEAISTFKQYAEKF